MLGRGVGLEFGLKLTIGGDNFPYQSYSAIWATR
jgi:hypothetical protein